MTVGNGRVVVALWGLLAVGGFGCAADEPGADAVAVQTRSGLEARLLDSWMLALPARSDLDPFTANPGWVSLVMERDLQEAVTELGPAGGLGAARAHTEAAAVYRQAALLSAHALIAVYGETPQPTDPAGAAHLLTGAYAITGDLESARAASDALVPEPSIDPWHTPWRHWLETGARGLPDLSTLPLDLPESQVGVWPEVAPPPHFRLAERAPSQATRDLADPAALVALAWWHDDAAALAAGPDAPTVWSARATARLPLDLALPVPSPAPLEVLFGGDLLVPGDGPFLAALTGEPGAAAVDAHADSSLIAWLARASMVAGTVDAGRGLQWADVLHELVQSTLEERAGTSEAHHRTFANLARVGLLRNLATVAQAQGDAEASGRLWLAAIELSTGPAACPVGLLQFAAWDTGNRQAQRSSIVIDGLARTDPALEIARSSLELLALRVAREKPGLPALP